MAIFTQICSNLHRMTPIFFFFFFESWHQKRPDFFGSHIQGIFLRNFTPNACFRSPLGTYPSLSYSSAHPKGGGSLHLPSFKVRGFSNDYNLGISVNKYQKYTFQPNPRPPAEPFSVTRPPKRVVATPLWIFYNKRPIPLCLLPMCRYESPFSSDTKWSTITLRMTSLWRHNVCGTSKFWTY